VGKTTCARILAKTINCTNITKEGEACNECDSCTSFEKGASLNIHELDAASNNSVDDIRTLVDQVRFAPQAGKYKVYIVDEVHMLSASAFNAFLKTLEEPPAHAIFILATTEKHKILPTILSRCQIFDFKRITSNDTVAHLEEIIGKEHIKAERNALQLIAQKSEGCMRDALSILDKIVSFSNGELTYKNTLEHLNILDEEYFFKLLEYLTKQDLTGAMLLYDEINQKGFEGDMVLSGLASFIRNLLVCKDPASAVLLESIEGWRDQYVNTAKQISTPYLISALNILNEAEIQFKVTRNKRLHVEMAIIKLNFLAQAIELSLEDNQIVKKKLVDAHYPIRLKKIVPLSNISVNAEAKLVIETPVTKAPQAAPAAPSKIEESPSSSLATTNEPTKQANSPAAPNVNTAMPKPLPSDQKEGGANKNLLAVLQQKYGKDYNIQEVKESVPLSLDLLQKCWDEYAVYLEANSKHASAGTFKVAQLKIEDEWHFTVTVGALTAQKFVEQERMNVLGKVWDLFQNRTIQFDILVEAGEQEDVPLHMRLNSKQKYDRIAEQYPLVAALKKRCNLEVFF
jgi:DNA polymerase-3 subunit gamma/tau